jgi:TldD protein
VTDTGRWSRLNVSVIVEQDGRRESGSAGGGGRFGLTGLERDTGRPGRARRCASRWSTWAPKPRRRA